jgi:hypothetical protein
MTNLKDTSVVFIRKKKVNFLEVKITIKNRKNKTKSHLKNGQKYKQTVHRKIKAKGPACVEKM